MKASIRLFTGLLAAGLVLVSSHAEAKWLRAETARLVVYSDGDERTLKEYAVRLEDFDTIMRATLGLDPNGVPPRKFELYLVKNTLGLRRLSPGVSESLRGFYSASGADIFAIAIRNRAEDADDTIYHEYSHHFMFQNIAGTFPGWLVEGFAEYFGTVRMTPAFFELGTANDNRGYTLFNGEWTSFDDLLTKRTGEIKGEAVFGFYAQAWLLTHYMLAAPERRRQLVNYANAVASGKESKAAWIEATGEDLATLEKKLRVYMRGNLVSTRYKRGTYAEAAVKVTALPPSADDLLLENLRLRTRDVSAEDGKFLAMIRQRAAAWPDDHLARMTLAEAELNLGDKTAGMAILEELIAKNPQDAEALRTKALRIMEDAAEEGGDNVEARFNEAGRLLVRANKAQPDDYRTLYAYAMSRQVEDDYPSENTLLVLETASELAPQVDEVRILTARALMMERRFEEAELHLRPVANDPHGGGGSETARSLLKQIALERSVSSGK